MSKLVLAVPSKGRLQEQTFAFFADCGLAITQDSGDRGYSARMAASPDVDVRLLSASEIARALHEGEVHLGVTGEDLLRELGDGFSRIALVRALGFGRADLVVAAPSAWFDVTTMADLDAVAAAFRLREGRRIRVATKYLCQAQAFFRERGVEDFRIVESAGATEGAPAAGAAEVIVDITTTGATLAANHLRPLADGVILRSQAHLAATHAARWSDQARAALRLVLDMIEARALARKMRLVRAAVAPGKEGEAARMGADLGGMPAGGGQPGMTTFYCPIARIPEMASRLAAAGASTVGVQAVEYVFLPVNPVYEAFIANAAEGADAVAPASRN